MKIQSLFSDLLNILAQHKAVLVVTLRAQEQKNETALLDLGTEMPLNLSCLMPWGVGPQRGVALAITTTTTTTTATAIAAAAATASYPVKLVP